MNELTTIDGGLTELLAITPLATPQAPGQDFGAVLEDATEELRIADCGLRIEGPQNPQSTIRNPQSSPSPVPGAEVPEPAPDASDVPTPRPGRKVKQAVESEINPQSTIRNPQLTSLPPDAITGGVPVALPVDVKPTAPPLTPRILTFPPSTRPPLDQFVLPAPVREKPITIAAPIAKEPVHELEKETVKEPVKAVKATPEVAVATTAVVLPFIIPAVVTPQAAPVVIEDPAPAPQEPIAQPPQKVLVPVHEAVAIEVQRESIAAPAPAKPGVVVPFEPHLKVVVASAHPQQQPFSQEERKDEEPGPAPTSKPETPQAALPQQPAAGFEPHIAAPRPSQPVEHIARELPEQPVPQVAHRVSIDVGDAENRVTVTLHERGGEVSMKVHAATESMKADLQSNVGTLVEAFQREDVHLANMDFTSSGQHAESHSDPDARSDEQQQPRRRHFSKQKFSLESQDEGVHVLA
jgi:hypothetical protein